MGVIGDNLLVGHGYDMHRLEPLGPEGAGRPLVVGGVLLEHERGPVAHSDGDVLLHAVTDAVLGALALPDIGQSFSNTDPANAGRDSSDFVRFGASEASRLGYRVVNLDATVVLERPRLGGVKAEMRRVLSDLLGIPVGRANVKGKTGEGLGPVGEGLAIEAHAVVLLARI